MFRNLLYNKLGWSTVLQGERLQNNYFLFKHLSSLRPN